MQDRRCSFWVRRSTPEAPTARTCRAVGSSSVTAWAGCGRLRPRPSYTRLILPELSRGTGDLAGYGIHRPNLGNYEGQPPSVLFDEHRPEYLQAQDALNPTKPSSWRRSCRRVRSRRCTFPHSPRTNASNEAKRRAGPHPCLLLSQQTLSKADAQTTELLRREHVARTGAMARDGRSRNPRPSHRGRGA